MPATRLRWSRRGGAGRSGASTRTHRSGGPLGVGRRRRVRRGSVDLFANELRDAIELVARVEIRVGEARHAAVLERRLDDHVSAGPRRVEGGGRVARVPEVDDREPRRGERRDELLLAGVPAVAQGIEARAGWQASSSEERIVELQVRKAADGA